MTLIEEICKSLPGTSIEDIELTVKTAKKCTKAGEFWFQDVMFTDGKNDILGTLRLGEKRIPIQRNQLLHIGEGTLVKRNINNVDRLVLYSEKWEHAIQMTADEYEEEQLSIKDEYHKQNEAREYMILRCAMLKVYRQILGAKEPLDEPTKELINRDVEFIREGK